MNFRRLEITGFKSFADKVEIEFEPGTTAVVGPNGCGKSNICDAIKWALGEQNAKSLRAEKMESIIFNGGSNRKALGMAQVTLTISNSEKTFESDYADVEVNRRLFRSGESEYYINKNRCLLKDIQEIFMDTGLGVNSYSIMEQGHIDMILNSNPQDRRLILEEAAGITKFRHRKRLSLKKLESTEQNLLRVSDIIYELESQINSLRRQASKARRYQDHLNELRGLDTKLSLRRYKTLMVEFGNIQQKIESSDDRLNFLESAITRIESELESHRLEMTESEAKLSDFRIKERQVQTRIEETESKIAVFKERRSNLQQRQKNAITELTRLQNQLEDSEKQIKALSIEKGKLGESIQNQENELSLSQERADKLAQTVASEEKELDEMKAQTIGILNKKARAQNELSAATSRLDYLVTRLERLASNTENFKNEQSEMENAVVRLEGEIEDREKIIDELTERQKQLDSEIRQNQAQLSSLEKNIRELEQRRNARSSRLQSLKELQEAHEGYNAGVKAILGKKDSLNGIFGAVAEIIRTESQYETAIEASLGAGLQDIVAENLEHAMAALNYLKERKNGRATLWMASLIHSGNSLPEKLPEGVLAVASRVVEFEAMHLPVVEYLLGNTLIVEDLDNAIRIFDEMQNGNSTKPFKVVTLDGQVLWSEGSVSGGTGSEGAGLLRRSREIVDLAKEVDSLDDELNQLDIDRDSLASEIQGFQREKDKVSRDLQKEHINHSGLQKDIAQNKQRLTRLEKEISIVESERESLEKEIVTLEESKVKSEEAAAEFDGQAEEINRKINALQTEMRSKVQERDAVVQQCTNMKVQLASKKQQEKGLAEKLKSLEQSRDKLAQTLSSHQNSASSDEEAEKSLTEEISKQEKQLEELFGERTKIEGEISKLETQRQKAQVELSQAESSIRENRRELDQMGQSKYQLEINKTQLKMNIDALIVKMRERYAISLEDQQDENLEEATEEDGDLESRIDELRTRMDNMGSVNLTAIDEYNRQKERYDLMVTQKEDLEKAKDSLYNIIQRINRESRDRLKETFDSVNASFQDLFKRLFGGGHAELVMDTEGDVLESGVDIVAQPPGKKPQSISMLSSGERTLTAIAILFALFKSKPSPFCVLDEVDAALDDANVGRFAEMVQEFARDTQFIIITHNKRTMQIADVLYGITMEEPGVSKMVSLRMNSGRNADQAAGG